MTNLQDTKTGIIHRIGACGAPACAVRKARSEAADMVVVDEPSSCRKCG